MKIRRELVNNDIDLWKNESYILSNNNVLSQAHTCSRIKSLGPLHYSSLSAGAHSRSTTEAVTVCLYVYTLQLFGRRNLIHCHGIWKRIKIKAS